MADGEVNTGMPRGDIAALLLLALTLLCMVLWG